MKKSAIALMGLACTLAVSSFAFAASPITGTDGNDAHNVMGQYHANAAAATVYSVDVAWDSMAFTYTVDSEGTWKPDTHTFADASEGSWSEDNNTVKVTNHSNAAVNVTVAYAAEESYSGITGSFSNGSFRLATAENTEVDSAPTQTATLTLTGALDKSVTDSTKLGTATVTISQAD